MMAAATDDEVALLARLQSQFADMNVSNFLNITNNEQAEESDESSLEEPSTEELLKWQEAQFQKGRMKMEAKKLQSESIVDVHKEALRGRRNKSAHERLLLREYEEENEWEKVSRLPDLRGEASAFFPADDASELGIHPMLHSLTSADPEILGTEWKRLYSSSHGDGLNFHHLWEKIRGYKGPTVMLIGGEPSSSKCLDASRDDKRVALGFFTTDYWIESADSFGSDDDCFLFGLDATTSNVKIIRPKSRSVDKPAFMSPLKTPRFLYCHPSSTSKSKNPKTAVFGLGVGGSPSQPRLHISESLEECRCLKYDALFEDGDILLGKCDSSLCYFDIDTIEVWGVGGSQWIQDALSSQSKERAIRESALKQAKRVDKRQLLEHFENGVLNTAAGGGLFGHLDFVNEIDVDCRIGN